MRQILLDRERARCVPVELNAVAEPSFVQGSLQRCRMIKTEVLSANALKIVPPEKLKAYDFLELAPQVDAIIAEHGTIRLLIDASHVGGWENMAAFEKHAGFMRDHQMKVERIAVIASHDWQHWVIGTVRVFVHPEVRSYDEAQVLDALQWIVG